LEPTEISKHFKSGVPIPIILLYPHQNFGNFLAIGKIDQKLVVLLHFWMEKGKKGLHA